MINWFCHMYPYGNLHELTLDWVIDTVKHGEKEIADFIGVNTIKYANPILWNIESQYEANTVVVDGQTGNAYISVKAVPSGVHLNREEYWTQIYNYANVVDTLREQIAYNEGESTTATRPYIIDDLVFVNGILYRVIAPMIAGDSFVVDSNVVQTTINEEIARLHGFITDEASARESADDTLQSNIEAEASARESADDTLQSNIEAEASARENADNNILEQISGLDVNHVYNQSTPGSGITTNIGLKEGTYNITENTTINAQLVIPKGAIINISSGVTLTINGQILAGRYQIFSGSGDLVVNDELQPVGFPEWFGALSDSTIDSLNAIQKCIDVFNITELSESAYYVSNTIIINSNNKTLRGVTSGNVAHYTDHTAMLVYPDNFANVGIKIGDINNAIANRPFGITIQNLTISNYLSNSGLSTSKGITCATIQSCQIKNVRIRAFHIGLEVVNTSYSQFDDIIISAPENDINFIGINIPNVDMTYTGIGTNSTVYFRRIAVNGLDGLNNIGFNFNEGFGLADTFVTQLECYGCRHGVYAKFKNADLPVRNQNIYFDNCLFDYSDHAFTIITQPNTNPYRPAISITNPYIEMRTATSDPVAFSLNEDMSNTCDCQLSIIGGIITGTQPNGIGLKGYGFTGVTIKGTMFRQIARLIETSTDTDVSPNNSIDVQLTMMNATPKDSIIYGSLSYSNINIGLLAWSAIGQLFDSNCNYNHTLIDVSRVIPTQSTNGIFGNSPLTLDFTEPFTPNTHNNTVMY